MILILLTLLLQVTITGQVPFTRILSPSVKPIGLALCKGNWKSVANAVLNCEEVKTIIVDLILKELSNQCSHLCEKIQFSSMLRRSSVDALLKFTCQNLVDEWKVHAPLFLSFLQAVAAPPRPRNKKKGLKLSSRYPAMCMGGAVLLKERNQEMSALHQLVGLYLFHGDLHKAVSNINRYALVIRTN